MTTNNIKEEILGEFKEEFPTLPQLFKQGGFEGSWDFTEYFETKFKTSLDKYANAKFDEIKKQMDNVITYNSNIGTSIIYVEDFDRIINNLKTK